MMHKTQILFLISIAYTAALLYFSALPAVGPGAGAYTSGNNLHFIAYAVYSALLFATFSRITHARKPIIISMIIAIAIGALAEIIQLYVPGRFCDAADWLVDALGALAGLALLVLLNKKLRSSHENKSKTQRE